MILPKKDLTLFQTALKVGAVYTSGGKGTLSVIFSGLWPRPNPEAKTVMLFG